MRGLRTIPVLLDMCRDMEELCPDVTFLNYVNPMAMNCWAVSRAHHDQDGRAVPQRAGHGASSWLDDIGVPIDEINYVCAGINHMAFYLSFERDGAETSTRAFARWSTKGACPDWNRVRYEMLKRLGYFVTESSEHFASTCPGSSSATAPT